MSEDMRFGLDNEPEVTEEEKTVSKRKPFATWEVGGEIYKLALTTGVICQLEAKFNCKNLMVVVDDPDGIPSLGTMLTIVQGAMQKYNHGMSFMKVQKLYDDYMASGKTQTEFFAEVIIPIFEVSGFFTAEMSEMIDSESTAAI